METPCYTYGLADGQNVRLGRQGTSRLSSLFNSTSGTTGTYGQQLRPMVHSFYPPLSISAPL